VELDVPASGPAVVEKTWRHEVAVAEPDPEPVGSAGLPVVLHPHAEAYRLVAIRPGKPADVARVWKRRIPEISGDLGAVHVIRDRAVVSAVIDVVDVPPERAVLAPAVGAEVASKPSSVHTYPPPVMKSHGTGTQ
jgi:hypothetical protein